MGALAARTVRLKDGTAMVVRSATLEDLPALLELIRDVVETSPHTVTTREEYAGDVAAETHRAALLDHMQKAGYLQLIALNARSGEPMGELAFRCKGRVRMRHHGHFGIGVAQAWRGKGVGSALIEALLEWAREHPFIEKVCLGVLENNHGARRLYGRLGFTEEGRRVGEFRFEDGTYVDDIQMSLWVKPRGERRG